MTDPSTLTCHAQVALVHARTYRVKKVLKVPSPKSITWKGWVKGGGRFYLVSFGPPISVGPPFTWTFLVFSTPDGALLHRRVFQETTSTWTSPPAVSHQHHQAIVFQDNLHAIIISMSDLSTQSTIPLAGAEKAQYADAPLSLTPPAAPLWVHFT